MEAKQCDRCGKFYIPYDLRESNYSLFDMQEVLRLPSMFSEQSMVDLCKECLEKLDEFMNNGKDEGGDND